MNNNTIHFFPLFFLVLIVSLFAGSIEYPPQTPFLEHKEFCLQYLKEGVLYNGQPYCPQGPVTYIAAYLLTFFPWGLDTDIQIGAILFLFFSFIFLYKWEEEETSDTGKVLIAIFFIFYFIPLGYESFSSLVPTTFLLIATYFLWGSKIKNKELYSGIFLGLAVFAKANFLLPVASILLFAYIENCTGKREISLRMSIQREKLKQSAFLVLKLLLPILTIFVILKILFPDFITYYYTAQAKHISASELFSAAKILLSGKYAFNGVFLLFYLSIMISAVRIFFTKAIDIFSWMCCFVFSFMMVLMINAYGITNITETYRFFFTIMPFFLIQLTLFKKEITYFSKKLLLVTIILFLFLTFFLYQGIGGIPLDHFFDEEEIIKQMQREMLYPLTEIPPQTNMILIDKNYTQILATAASPNHYRYLNESSFDLETITDQHAYERPDMSYAPFLVELGVLPSLEPYNWTVEVNLSSANETFQHGNYPIVIGGVYYGPTLRIIRENFNRFKELYHCTASIGVLEGGYVPETPHRIVLYFQDINDCAYLKEKIRIYYLENFDSLCKRGRYASTIINEIFEKNKEKQLEKQCRTVVRTSEFMVAANFRALYFCFILYTFLIWLLVPELWRRRKNKKQ